MWEVRTRLPQASPSGDGDSCPGGTSVARWPEALPGELVLRALTTGNILGGRAGS